MIISCEKCGTKFRLDDDAVKPSGVRVRCSVCGHIFTVYPAGGAAAHVPEEAAGNREPRGGHKEKKAIPVGRPPGGGDDFEDFLSQMDHDFLEEDLETPAKHKRTVDVEEEEDAADLFAASKQEKKRPSLFWRFFRVFLLILLLLGVSVAALYYWKPALVQDYGKYFEKYIPARFFEPAVDTPDAGASHLVLSGDSGDFVESGVYSDLFVIRGHVKNEFPETRSFIQLRGSILDENGEVVSKRTVYAGNPIPDDRLKDMSSEEIAEAMNNRDGIDGMNVNLPPGSSIPFTIVFENLPENVVEYTVEAVGSAPGTL
jgi:predicted Zn finger-like uncharacterized protein